MKIVVASDSGQVACQLARCTDFQLFYTDGLRILREETLVNPGLNAGFLPNYLSGLDAHVVIAGSVSHPCTQLLEAWSISVVTGIQGDSREAVHHFLTGQLPADLSGHRKSGRQTAIR